MMVLVVLAGPQPVTNDMLTCSSTNEVTGINICWISSFAAFKIFPGRNFMPNCYPLPVNYVQL